VKRNILASTFILPPLFNQQEFSRYALNYLVFGNAFLELRKNQLGEPICLQCSPAKYTRRGVEPDTYLPIGLCRTGRRRTNSQQAACFI
jgi:capsid portal protein